MHSGHLGRDEIRACCVPWCVCIVAFEGVRARRKYDRVCAVVTVVCAEREKDGVHVYLARALRLTSSVVWVRVSVGTVRGWRTRALKIDQAELKRS